MGRKRYEKSTDNSRFSISCGGAGIQADLKAMSALGVYGMSVITAVTAQNTQGVFGVQEISKEIIQKQIEVIFEDIEVDAVKVGMLSSSEITEAIGEMFKKYNVKKYRYRSSYGFKK